MTDQRRFVLRTIHDGRVRIDGATYRPSEQFLAYDGRLNGQRFAFGRYYRSDGCPDSFVCLWGSEDHYRSETAEWPGADCVDGFFPWLWWNREVQA